jgi:hypothetical protein
MKKILGKVWGFVSVIFVLYGFYLLFLFFYDTLLRLSPGIALPLSLLLTLTALLVSAFFWLRKHLHHIRMVLKI